MPGMFGTQITVADVCRCNGGEGGGTHCGARVPNMCVLHALIVHHVLLPAQTSPPVLPFLQRLPPDWDGVDTAGSVSSDVVPDNIPRVTTLGPANPLTLSRMAENSRDRGGRAPPRRVFKEYSTYFFDPGEPQAGEPCRGLDLLRSFAQRNEMSPGGLLLHFFWTYSVCFDFQNHVLGIRCAEPINKVAKVDADGWKRHNRLSIEDPFETSYDVSHVLKPATNALVRGEIARAYTMLSTTNPETLTEGESLLEVLMRK